MFSDQQPITKSTIDYKITNRCKNRFSATSNRLQIDNRRKNRFPIGYKITNRCKIDFQQPVIDYKINNGM